jgi:hypothetical protein
MHYQSCTIFLATSLCVCLETAASAQRDNLAQPSADANAELFAFSLPGDDPTMGVTDLAFLNARPADELVSVRGGHFYAGNKRIRFWGINNCFNANFPSHEEARLLARRFANLGMNLLRITETDCDYAPKGLFDPKYPGQLRIVPSQLDKLDYFIAELKRQGIYVELSVHIQHWRNITGSTQVPGMEKDKFGFFAHGMPFWNETFLNGEKQWAREFLGHVNPYTGKAYTEEPAVAYVEILNENGLISGWNHGSMRRSWPPAMVADLQSHWNAFLRARYTSSDRLRRAWAPGEVRVDPRNLPNLLQNANFAHAQRGWDLRPASVSSTALEVAEHGGPDGQACVVIHNPHTAAKDIVSLVQTGLAIEKGCAYRVTFQVRADEPLRLSVSVSKADPPGKSLGMVNKIDVTNTWQKITRDFVGTDDERRGRLTVSLPTGAVRVSLAEFSLRKVSVIGLRPGEALETGNVSMPLSPADCVTRTRPVATDFADFLLDVDRRYFATMYAFLKDELGCKHPIKGTQVNKPYSSYFSQVQCDFIDAHGYWQMPVFAKKEWDPEGWSIANTPMVNRSCELVVELAGSRVAGKPYVVSEYCHPAPSTYCSEEAPTVGALAAQQDWDGITLYSWAHEPRANYAGDRIPDFFDHNHHPLKLVTMPFAALAFRRGDVAAAREETTIGVTRNDELQWLAGGLGQAYFFRIAERKGASWLDMFTHRLGLALGSDRVPMFLPHELKRAQSDTGQLVCDVTDPAGGVLTVSAPRAKAVIGFGAGKTFTLDDVTIKPGPTRQHGFSVITASAVRGGDLHSPGAALLVTATGYAENTGMVWNADKTSVGDKWGKAPVLCEGIPFELSLPSKTLRAWALDPRGRRAREVPVSITPTGALLRLGPQYRTLWYEVAIDAP